MRRATARVIETIEPFASYRLRCRPVDRLPRAALTIVVAVVDDQTPQVADTMRTTTTVLGVSAGATTAGQLARTASSAAADGREIAGILVADPNRPTTLPAAFRSSHGRGNTGYPRV